VDSDFLLKAIRSIKLDADFEVTSVVTKADTTSLERGKITGIDSMSSNELVIRCIYKNKMSILIATPLSESDIKKFLTDAYTRAKLAGSTDSQSTFSRSQPTHNKRFKSDSISKSEFSHIIKEIIHANSRVSQIKKVYSTNSFVASLNKELSIANSNGVTGEQTANGVFANAEIIARNESDRTTGHFQCEARTIDDINVPLIFDLATKRAVSMLGAKQAPTGFGKLLLAPDSAIDILSAFISAMNGELILKKRSFLTGKKGLKLFSDKIKLREEPFLKNSPHNRWFDDELTPTTAKDLVSDGMLRTYLHNIYSAERMKEKSTGNAFKSGIDTTNVVLKPEKGDVDEFIKMMDKGIYLIETGDSPNMSTGDLSAMVAGGYYVEHGKIMYPVKETMIGVNMLDLMRNVIAVGEDVLSFDGISTPSILVKDVKISGR